MARLFDDGSNQYVHRDASPCVAPPCTLAAYVYTDNDTAIQTILQLCDKGVADHYVGIFLDGANPGDHARAIETGGVPTGSVLSSTGFSTNTWHHVAGVFATTTSRSIYLDGGGKQTDTDSVTSAGFDRVTVGRTGDSTPGAYMSGRVAEAGVWNVALTDAEVAELASAVSPLQVRPQSLVSLWRLIRNDNDIVGGHNMTPYNSPTWAAHPRVYGLTSAQTSPTPVAAAGPARSGGRLLGWKIKA